MGREARTGGLGNSVQKEEMEVSWKAGLILGVANTLWNTSENTVAGREQECHFVKGTPQSLD